VSECIQEGLKVMNEDIANFCLEMTRMLVTKLELKNSQRLEICQRISVS
jgi:hypothetical protein